MPPHVNTSRKSPNHSSRIGYPVRLMLLHATVGGLRSSLDWLCDSATRVSSHYVISKEGVIYQLVAETESAWHAGTAVWQGETAVNEISIGVELENLTGMRGFKGQDPYPDAQIKKLTELVRNLMERYKGIAVARHLDVALPKKRKSDPAGFPWVAWRAQLVAPAPPPASRPHRVIGLPVYQRADHTGALWGHLVSNEQVVIDDSVTGHLADDRGFVDLAGLEPM